MPFSGSYEVRSVEASETEFTVEAFDWVFETGGSVTVVERSGRRVDMTRTYYNANADTSSPW